MRTSVLHKAQRGLLSPLIAQSSRAHPVRCGSPGAWTTAWRTEECCGNHVDGAVQTSCSLELHDGRRWLTNQLDHCASATASRRAREKPTPAVRRRPATPRGAPGRVSPNTADRSRRRNRTDGCRRCTSLRRPTPSAAGPRAAAARCAHQRVAPATTRHPGQDSSTPSAF